MQNMANSERQHKRQPRKRGEKSGDSPRSDTNFCDVPHVEWIMGRVHAQARRTKSARSQSLRRALTGAARPRHSFGE